MVLEGEPPDEKLYEETQIYAPLVVPLTSETELIQELMRVGVDSSLIDKVVGELGDLSTGISKTGVRSGRIVRKVNLKGNQEKVILKIGGIEQTVIDHYLTAAVKQLPIGVYVPEIITEEPLGYGNAGIMISEDVSAKPMSVSSHKLKSLEHLSDFIRRDITQLVNDPAIHLLYLAANLHDAREDIVSNIPIKLPKVSYKELDRLLEQGGDVFPRDISSRMHAYYPEFVQIMAEEEQTTINTDFKPENVINGFVVDWGCACIGDIYPDLIKILKSPSVNRSEDTLKFYLGAYQFFRNLNNGKNIVERNEIEKLYERFNQGSAIFVPRVIQSIAYHHRTDDDLNSCREHVEEEKGFLQYLLKDLTNTLQRLRL